MAMSNRQVEFGTLLNRVSAEVATIMWEAYVHHTPMTETTVTQYILREVQKEATYIQVSTPNEAQTGADWQWIILNSAGQRTTVLCQAKILDPQTGTYPHLAHKVGGLGGPQQVDTLLAYAHLQNAEAFYVLYNYTLYDERVTEANNKNNGCFVVGAADMKGQIDTYVASPYVDTTSLSWAEIKQYASPLREFIRFA